MDLTPEYAAVLRLFLAGPQMSENPPTVYDDLMACGWICATAAGVRTYHGVTQVYDNCWAITPQGRVALSAYDKSVEHDAQEKKQNRITNNLAAVNIVVSLVSFVLGLLADHYLGIVVLVESFFHAAPPV